MGWNGWRYIFVELEKNREDFRANPNPYSNASGTF